MISNYQKKATIIKAVQFLGTEESANEIAEWVIDSWGVATVGVSPDAVSLDVLADNGVEPVYMYDFVVREGLFGFKVFRPSDFSNQYTNNLNYDRDYLLESGIMIEQEQRVNSKYSPGASLFAQLGLAQQVKRIADILDRQFPVE